MVQRTQEINNMLVRTRSDFTIKIENIAKEIAKIWNDHKLNEKTVGYLTSTVPILLEIVLIILVKNLH